MKKCCWNAVAFVLVITMTIAMLPQFTVSAAPSLKDQIDAAEQEKRETEKEKKKAEEEKNEKKNQLENLQIKQGNMKLQLQSLDEEMAEATEYLGDLENKIELKNQEIEAAQVELKQAEEAEAAQYASMKKRVQAMYEQPNNSYLELLASSESFGEFLNIADYIFMISSYDKRMFEKDKELKKEVEEKKAVLLEEASELDALKELALAEKDRINSLITTTSAYVAQYTSQIGSAQSEISEIEKEIERKERELAEQEKDLEALKKRYEEELAMSQQAANATKRDVSEITYEPNDRYLLANLIYCEAGGESYEGQLAVGAVVINRVLSSCYPDTVSGVIYQKSQFSPVASGRLALALAQDRATTSCYTAADAAMGGQTNVGNCYYFRTPIPGLVGIQIGGHIFY